MSDIADVLTRLAAAATASLYPNGTGSPSITGTPIVIYPGWPTSANLDDDLAAGKTHVTVFPKAEERNTTRYPEKRLVTTPPVTTLTLEFTGSGRLLLEGGGSLLLEGGGDFLEESNQTNIAVGGTVSIPQNVMLRVNGKHYVYAVQAEDSLETIAQALAGLVAVDIPNTGSNGAQIIVGSTGRVQAARVGGFGTVMREVRRQERVVMITVWAGTPALRDAVTAAVDVSLAAQRFITMPDGFGARIIYKNSLIVDSLQKAALYRRDLNYMVEFATTIAEQAAAVIAPKIELETVLGFGRLELEGGGDLLSEGGSPIGLEETTSETTITI